jgi:hypothetical protein
MSRHHAAVAAELAPFAPGWQPDGEGNPPAEAKVDDATRPAGESPTGFAQRSAGLDVQNHRPDRRRRCGEARKVPHGGQTPKGGRHDVQAEGPALP